VILKWINSRKAILKRLSISWFLKSIRSAIRIKHEFKAINQTISKLDELGSEGTVIIFSSIPLFTDHVLTEYALASEFQQQGHRVLIVFCDKDMPICHAHDRYSCGDPSSDKSNPKTANVCGACNRNYKSIKHSSNIETRSFSSYFSKSTDAPVNTDLSEDRNAGVVRYLATSRASDPEKEKLSSLYMQSAKAAADVVQNVIDTEQPLVVIAHHGIYVPQGIVNKICASNSVSFYSWHFGYRKSTLIFSKANTYHKEMGQIYPLTPLSKCEQKTINDYLKSRWSGDGDWIHFNRSPIKLETTSRRTFRVVFYSSVDWDAALHFDKNVYANQFDFVADLVNASRKFSDIEFVLRVHPAESSGHHPSHSKLDRFVESLSYKNNVTVIAANDGTSSYELAESCDVAIVYNTKLGIELTSMGIPTIVAGESWVRDRGFTWDINCKEDLTAYLSQISSMSMTAEMKEAALSFAYYFYFQRCIDVPELKSVSKKFHVAYDSGVLKDDRGLPFIARRIINGDMVYVER